MVADAYKRQQDQARHDGLPRAPLPESAREDLDLCRRARSRLNLNIGGSANLVAYIGHNGLMDFQLPRHPDGTLAKANATPSSLPA